MRALETYLSFAHERFSKNKKAINVRTSVWNWLAPKQKLQQALKYRLLIFQNVCFANRILRYIL